MTPKETGKLLGFAALYDARNVDSAVVVAWHQVIGDLPYRDAETAVRTHYSSSTERLMPAHIREIVREIRAERLRLNPIPPPPPELCDDGPAYAAYVAEHTRRIENGEAAPKAIRGPQ